jgi:hypothetical protein
MDYGRSYDPYIMGQHAVDAMTATVDQLQELYGDQKSGADVRAMVGVTPMIGLNDVSPEVFTFGDAYTLLYAAQSNGIGFLSFWSAMRDQPCTRRQVVSPTCSGVVQSPWDFTKIFLLFTAYSPASSLGSIGSPMGCLQRVGCRPCCARRESASLQSETSP